MAKLLKSRAIKRGDGARKKLIKGLMLASDVISITLGPRGRNVIIDNEDQSPTVSNDGATIMKSLKDGDNHINNIAFTIAREASVRTESQSGDGTTSTVLLAASLAKEGLKRIEQNVNPIVINAGLKEGLAIVEKRIKEKAIPVKGPSDIKKIAYISSNNDSEIADIVEEAYDSIGDYGHITVEPNPQDNETRIATIDGINYGVGWKSTAFITNEIERKAILKTDSIKAKDGPLERRDCKIII